MKRFLAAAAVATAALGISVGPTPAAHAAVTNPADHPYPVTVKGDDGKTYTDGEDTLPGYDDVECTYIPGAWFDFDNNRVHYADGKSIPWTEWDRATGYAEWKAKQGKPSASATPTAKASSAPASKPSSKPASTPTRKPTASTGTRTTTTTKSSATPSPAASTATGSATATAVPTGAASPADVTASAAATEAGVPVGDSTAAPAAAVPSGSPSDAASEDQLAEVSADTSGNSLSGLAIIGGLVAVGAVLLGGNAVYRRSRKESAH